MDTSIDEILEILNRKIKLSIDSSVLAQESVTLLGASKGQSVPLIEAAIIAGLNNFGENRVQEAESKWPVLLEKYPQTQLHLIGPLQSNKVKQAVALFHVIQTLDRPSLADALAGELARTGKSIRCFIQVNSGKEPQKSGVSPEEADAFINYCKTQLHLPVVGLMCVPPHDQRPAPHFAMLRKMAHRHGLNELSMGMSEDFETAVRLGSSCVRLGRALFGERLA